MSPIEKSSASLSWCWAVVLALPILGAAALPVAAGDGVYTLTIKDHRFKPETITVSADKAFDLTVVNVDPTAEEFESNDFHVEKVIGGGKQMTFHIGPLKAGSYGFFGERHMETALGNLFAE